MGVGSAQGKQLESGPRWQNWLTLLVMLQLLFSACIQLHRLLLLFQFLIEFLSFTALLKILMCLLQFLLQRSLLLVKFCQQGHWLHTLK